jgi:hypothetical protein
MEFLIANGKVAGKDEINLNHFLTESTFRLSQKVWYGYGGIPFFTENLEHKNSDRSASVALSKEFENQGIVPANQTHVEQKQILPFGVCSFSIVLGRKQVQTIITANAFEQFNFPFNEAGLLVTFSNQKKHTQNTFNRFPFFNETIWESVYGRDSANSVSAGNFFE